MHSRLNKGLCFANSPDRVQFISHLNLDTLRMGKWNEQSGQQQRFGAPYIIHFSLHNIQEPTLHPPAPQKKLYLEQKRDNR